MKTIRQCFLIFVILCLAGCSGQGTEPSSSGRSRVAFTGVTVIPMDRERLLRDQTVLVEGDRIVQIGPTATTEVSEGTTTVDGSGKYLIPGFGEMHGHIPDSDSPHLESILFLYVSNGVTTVRGMLGRPGQLELRAKISRGELLGPTLYLAGPSFSGRSVESPQQAVERVRKQKSEGWDLLKIHPGLTQESYDAMANTAKEVGIPFAGHIPADVGLLHALEMGQQTVDHLDGYIEYLGGDAGPVSDSKLGDVTRLTLEAGAWVIPTMALWETVIGAADLEAMRAYPELRYMAAEEVKRWVESFGQRTSRPEYSKKRVEQIVANRDRLLKALSDGGVRILFGTDAPQLFSVPGFSIHRELQHMAKVGLSPYQIIESGTKNMGDYFADQDQFGRIELGARADLILLEANPLEDVANMSKRAGVMVRGRWLPEEEIQQRLEAIAASYPR